MDLNPLVLWEQMTILNKGVIVILITLSVWSLYVCVERLIVFSKARKQSLLFARQATEHLKNDRPQAAIDAASKYPQSHLARVVSAGLQSFQYESQTSPLSETEIVEPPPRRRARHAADHLGPEAGHRLAGHHRHHHPLHRPVRHRDRHHQRLPRHR